MHLSTIQLILTKNIHTTTPTASAALFTDDAVGSAPDAAAEEAAGPDGDADPDTVAAADPDTDGVAAEASGIDVTL